jgi:hypothetical protein
MSSTSRSTHTIGTQEDQAALQRLASEMAARGYQADLRVPDGRLPYLEVRNPRAAMLAEKVYAQAGAFWWSWAETIAHEDEVTTTASILAHVLRTVDGE